MCLICVNRCILLALFLGDDVTSKIMLLYQWIIKYTSVFRLRMIRNNTSLCGIQWLMFELFKSRLICRRMICSNNQTSQYISRTIIWWTVTRKTYMVCVISVTHSSPTCCSCFQVKWIISAYSEPIFWSDMIRRRNVRYIDKLSEFIWDIFLLLLY